MHISVIHTLNYRYSKPVYLEPQLIYLTPRWGFNQEISDLQLEISPTPSLLAANIDAEGNAHHVAHFEGLTGNFTVKSSFCAKTSPVNPFGFVIYPYEAQTVPLHYPVPVKPFLQPYLKIVGDEKILKDYCRPLLGDGSLALTDFIPRLAQTVSNGFAYEYREEGEALLPESLLNSGKGTCRDFSNLYMQVCRHLGIAARFVSGYFHGDPDQSRHLHGWVEVFIPGGGWRGVDPTQGVMTDDKYIALAASADTGNVAPVSGHFRGDAVAVMDTSLKMEEIAG